jgi:predicted membrane channel-forming protein YqfA (hemolysin III family)
MSRNIFNAETHLLSHYTLLFLMIKMFEQTAALAAGYTATLFITMILAMVLLSAFWAKTDIYRK